MAEFYGRHEHRLDAKGRVILPAEFRAHFPPSQSTGYLTQYYNGCLALWTPDEFKSRMSSMRERQEQGKAARNLARLWASGSQQVDIDRQGRMSIAPPLRGYAQLEPEQPVMVIGAIERIEFWNPEIWRTQVEPYLAEMLEDEEDEAV